MKTELTVFNPGSLDELDQALAANQLDVTYVAGATDLMVQQDKMATANCLIDLSAISEITSKIDVGKNGVLIGAAVPLTDIMNTPFIKQEFPLLVQACCEIGSVQIQNRATLGGNIGNASPAGDSLPVLEVYDAEILIGPRDDGKFRHRFLHELIRGPGSTSFEKNSYIAYIYLPLPEKPPTFRYFRKVGPRHAMAISKVSLAVLGWKEKKRINDIRICTGSVAPRIQRALKTEELVRGSQLGNDIIRKATQQILEEIDPITDIRSTRSYRQSTSQALLLEALSQLREL